MIADVDRAPRAHRHGELLDPADAIGDAPHVVEQLREFVGLLLRHGSLSHSARSAARCRITTGISARRTIGMNVGRRRPVAALVTRHSIDLQASPRTAISWLTRTVNRDVNAIC